MKKLKTYDEFVNEGIMDVIKTPIKYVKIKNNLKKYQKAKVKQALNDVDFAKRKAKGRDEMTDKQKEVLTQANKAKNAALADTTSAISQRMNDLATSPILKKVVSLGTTKARLAANDVVFKSADGEEKKKLKIKANELQKKAAEVTGELKDYESTAAKKEEPAKVSQQNTDDIKTSKPEKTDKPEKTKKPEKEETTTDANADKKAKLEADIKSFNDNIEAERSRMTKAMKDLDQAKRDLKTGRGSDEGVQKIEKSIEDSKEDIAELKKKEADAKKKLQTLGESFEYVAESVSQKFARLRNEM